MVEKPQSGLKNLSKGRKASVRVGETSVRVEKSQ
jgi:hypothetical protein